MRIHTENGVRILEADDGAFVTNGETYSEKVYLGKNAPESTWRDATAEEYEEWQREHENPEPTAEDALTRYANELTGEQDETLLDATETLIKIVKEDN